MKRLLKRVVINFAEVHQGVWHYGPHTYSEHAPDYYEYIKCSCGWESNVGVDSDEVDCEREYRVHAGLDPRSQDEQAFDHGLTYADKMGGNS